MAATDAPAGAGWVSHPVLSRRFGPSLWRAWRMAVRMQPEVILSLNAGYAVLGGLTQVPVVTRVVGNDFSGA